ncbi:MAG: sulfite exporter TauE/SafE family protein [Pseudomonadota bacterium]
MIELSWTFFALAVPAVIFAGVSKGGFGSGASFASAAVMALILPPDLALGLMLPLLMLIDVGSLPTYWGKWSRRDVIRILWGALPGVALGVAVFRFADPDVIRFLIGAVALAFVAWQIAKSRGLVPTPARALGAGVGLLTGAVAGFTSFVSHAGGPPVAVYLLSQRLDKLTYQASTVLIFWVVNILKFIPYAALGAFTAETWRAVLLLAPVALFGTWLGVVAHRIVPERLFFAITYVLLVLTGTRLIWQALSAG